MTLPVPQTDTPGIPPWAYDDLDNDGMDEADAGDECGRWQNGRLGHSCGLGGTEFCDFECPFRNSLKFRGF